MSKKLLLSLLLIGVLAIGAGLGTYAWFTAEAKSEDNVFEVGTFKLESQGKVFELKNAEPGGEISTKKLTVKNTGSLPMILKAELTPTFYQASKKATLNFGDYFEIKATISYTDGIKEKPLYISEWMSVKDFADFVSKEWNQFTFEPKHELKVDFKLRLNEDAGNEYQGGSVEAALIIQARQAIEGAQFQN